MPIRQWSVLLSLLFLLCSAAFAKPKPSATVKIDFSRDVRPILAANCFACHGQDPTTRQAGLRLDTRDGAIALRNGRRALEGGRPERSPLVERINATDPTLLMPPVSSGRRLTPQQKATLTLWVKQGAPYATHWAFTPLKRPTVPAVKNRAWARNLLDAFVLARLEKAGLKPSPQADRYTLIRRVSLDLTGMPPTLEETERFVQDRAPDAYEKVVDRLLASPHYGEHWARMWLDLARYADSQGYEKDQPRTIWRYRDWVIDAFNADKPYDRFTIEQLAGDLLPNPTREQILATAFHRNTMTNTEGGVDPEEFRTAAVKDRVDTTVQVWMGLTMGCAKCHSHKYDPISHQDYYKFFALFNQTQDANNGDDSPKAPMPTEEQATQQATLQARRTTLQAALTQRAPGLRGLTEIAAIPAEKRNDEQKKRLGEALGKADPATVAVYRDLEATEKELATLEGKIARIPIFQELPPDKLRVTHIHQRGNFMDPGAVVTPDVPAAFGPLPAGAPHNRLGAAEWIVSRSNALTPRVAVNRFWARLFGSGLVETEEDFGTQGTPPTNQALLDWLAVAFRDDLGWSMKRLCKTIVLSATYRQASTAIPASLKADPRNQWLGRGPRFRLSAEMVRDQALAVSGLLSAKLKGPSVMPPQPDGIWHTVYSGLKWETSAGEDRYRRALYTYWRRTSPYPAMTTFDAGSGETCVVRRIRTNTPLQALVTLNDPAFVEAAGALGRAMLDAPTPGGKACLTYGFRRTLTRPPTEAETKRLVRLYNDARTRFQSRPETATALLNAAHATLSPGHAEAEQAACTLVANVLLNLDETLTKP